MLSTTGLSYSRTSLHPLQLHGAVRPRGDKRFENTPYMQFNNGNATYTFKKVTVRSRKTKRQRTSGSTSQRCILGLPCACTCNVRREIGCRKGPNRMCMFAVCCSAVEALSCYSSPLAVGRMRRRRCGSCRDASAPCISGLIVSIDSHSEHSTPGMELSRYSLTHR